MFQFHKVRLKVRFDELQMPEFIGFQFHKVRLKDVPNYIDEGYTYVSIP